MRRGAINVFRYKERWIETITMYRINTYKGMQGKFEGKEGDIKNEAKKQACEK